MIALGLTLGLMVGGMVVIALVAVLPAAVQFLDLGRRPNGCCWWSNGPC